MPAPASFYLADILADSHSSSNRRGKFYSEKNFKSSNIFKIPSKTVWQIRPVPPKSATFFGQKIVEKVLKVSFSICFNKRLTYISTQVVHSTSSSTQPFFRVTNLQGGWTFGFLSLGYSMAKRTLLFWFFFLKKCSIFTLLLLRV